MAIKNTFFLIFGPEASGNHAIEDVLQKMGCHGKSHRDFICEFIKGNVDNVGPCQNQNIAFIRSVPNRRAYAHSCFDPIRIHKRFSSIGYNIKTIIPVRTWATTILSNYREASIIENKATLEESWIYIAEYLKYLSPFMFCNTSMMFKYPEIMIKELELFTGLTYTADHYDAIRDPDTKRHKSMLQFDLKITDKKDIKMRQNRQRRLHESRINLNRTK